MGEPSEQVRGPEWSRALRPQGSQALKPCRSLRDWEEKRVRFGWRWLGDDVENHRKPIGLLNLTGRHGLLHWAYDFLGVFQVRSAWPTSIPTTPWPNLVRSKPGSWNGWDRKIGCSKVPRADNHNSDGWPWTDSSLPSCCSFRIKRNWSRTCENGWDFKRTRAAKNPGRVYQSLQGFPSNIGEINQRKLRLILTAKIKMFSKKCVDLTNIFLAAKHSKTRMWISNYQKWAANRPTFCLESMNKCRRCRWLAIFRFAEMSRAGPLLRQWWLVAHSSFYP